LARARIEAVVPAPTLHFKPLNFGRWVIWGLTALLLLTLPFIFTSKFALALMSQGAILIIFALSYNMLLGQSGMLSFGHAVYSGLGAYFAIHALNFIGKGQLIFPVSLLPLIGGLAGLLFGFIFGWLTTRKAGTPFAMITLGLGEIFRRRSRCEWQSHGGSAAVRRQGLDLWPGHPGLLPDRGLVFRLHGGDVRVDAHALGSHRQRGT
jgi:branched-chain amino acid transport system permease protein